MTEAPAIPTRKVLNLKYRVKCFFAANPEEELTPAEFRIKFNCTEHARRWLMGELGGEHGELESVHVVRLRTSGIAKGSK